MAESSLKDQGNEFFKSGNYLKAAALYTQAIKLDPSNHTLYRYFFLISTLQVFLHQVSVYIDAHTRVYKCVGTSVHVVRLYLLVCILLLTCNL